MMKRITIFVAVFACLACVAMCAPANVWPRLTNFVCDTCQTMVDRTKAQLPEIKPKLDTICELHKSAEIIQKCLEAVHKFEDMLENKSSKEICESIGLCKPKGNLFDFNDKF